LTVYDYTSNKESSCDLGVPNDHDLIQFTNMVAMVIQRQRQRVTMQSQPNGAEILTEAHKIITKDRNSLYGPVTEDYAKVIKIFAGITGIQLSMADALLFMVSVKLARLSTNLEHNRLHYDTLLDTLGYLALLNVAKDELPFPQTISDRS